ncbi:MAG: cytochrome c3 family protein [Candidatus Omnitrophica bacterium]|nr:cytochrome c3 family protein [Candidatus Omnitrophota bacterium]
MRKRLLFFATALCFLSTPSGAQTSSGNSCVDCHEETREDVQTSVHGRQGVLCNSCHGGDPTQTDKVLAKAPGTGYLGIPDKGRIAEKCGGCHADVEAMNFYGTRTDQLARYRTSHHGKKLSQGDERVAVCSDCHGYHDVVKVSDPSSPVYPLNVPETCNACHGKPKLMDAAHLPSDILEIYKSSVHGKALFEKKDLSVANCASCHGSHGAVPPGVKDVATTCGKCHVNEKKYFLESVHARAQEEGKFSECISCHGNHGVEHPTPALYQEACIRCHASGTPAFQQGQKIAAAIRDADAKLEETGALVRQASIEGFFVEPEMAQLEELKTNVLEMAPIQHTLSIDKLEALHGKVAKISEGVRQSVGSKRESLRRRKAALALIWIFIAVMVGALWTKYNRLTKHRHS